MDIVVKGRHQEVGEAFRSHAVEKLQRVGRLDHKVIRIDVELSIERNPRLASQKERIELTCMSKGPVIRAEAAAEDAYAALDAALDKLEARLRRAADRRRVHHGSRTPVSVAAAVAAPPAPAAETLPAPDADGHRPTVVDAEDDAELEGGLIVRTKTHVAAPMSLDQALLEMELVGHDFYLFHDAECDRPSVVYRRRGFDYGVIRLGT